jgi:cytochrome P450
MEGVLLIATLAQRWRLRLVPGHPVVLQPLITLRPKHGIRMTLEKR